MRSTSMYDFIYIVLYTLFNKSNRFVVYIKRETREIVLKRIKIL